MKKSVRISYSGSEPTGSKFSATWRPEGDFATLEVTIIVQDNILQVITVALGTSKNLKVGCLWLTWPKASFVVEFCVSGIRFGQNLQNTKNNFTPYLIRFLDM